VIKIKFDALEGEEEPIRLHMKHIKHDGDRFWIR
jgi:hypothetical protein